jgi:drug/metabolite transporter (DMT)-like permease
MSTPDNAKKIDSINFYFSGFWISVIVGVLLCSLGVIFIIMNKAEQVDDMPTFGRTEVIAKAEQDFGMKTIAQNAMLVGMVAMVIASVFGCELHYLLFRQIYDDIDPSTPAKAATSCFISLLAVVAGTILTLGYDSFHSLYSRPFYQSVGMLLFSLVGSVYAIFFFKSIKDHAVSLLKSEQ